MSECLELEVRTSRTVAEADVYGFAGITGDDHPNHTNEVYAAAQGLNGRVVQGSLLLGFMAGASVRYLNKLNRPAVSYGYDKVRFIKPVNFGDTIEVHFKGTRVDEEKKRLWADATVTNQRGELCAVGTNILQF